MTYNLGFIVFGITAAVIALFHMGGLLIADDFSPDVRKVMARICGSVSSVCIIVGILHAAHGEGMMILLAAALVVLWLIVLVQAGSLFPKEDAKEEKNRSLGENVILFRRPLR